MKKNIHVYIYQIDDCEPEPYATLEEADAAVREEIEFWRHEEQIWLTQEEVDEECDNAWNEYSKAVCDNGNMYCKSTSIFGHLIIVYLKSMEIDI